MNNDEPFATEDESSEDEAKRDTEIVKLNKLAALLSEAHTVWESLDESTVEALDKGVTFDSGGAIARVLSNVCVTLDVI